MTILQHIFMGICLFAIDVITVKIIRKLLRDFLRTKKNKWAMYELYQSQPLKSRITLDYIYPRLKRNQKAFVRYRKLYFCLLYTLIPQYLVILMLYLLIGDNAVFALLTFMAIKIIIYIIVRSNFDGLMISIYRYSGKGGQLPKTEVSSCAISENEK